MIVFHPGIKFCFCPLEDRLGQLTRNRNVKCEGREGPCSKSVVTSPLTGGSKDGSLLCRQNSPELSHKSPLHQERDVTA